MMIHWRLCCVPDIDDRKEGRTRPALSSRHEVIWVSRCLPHTGIPRVMKVVTKWYWNHRAEQGIWNEVWVGRWAGTCQGTEMGFIQAERTSCPKVKMHKVVPFVQRMVGDWVGGEHGIPGSGGKKKLRLRVYRPWNALSGPEGNGTHGGGWGMGNGMTES